MPARQGRTVELAGAIVPPADEGANTAGRWVDRDQRDLHAVAALAGSEPREARLEVVHPARDRRLAEALERDVQRGDDAFGLGPVFVAAAGDLLLHVQVRPDAEFSRRGDDIYSEVDVPAPIGVLGGKIFLDLCYEEDSKADVDMNFVMTGSGKFIEVQGTAENVPFSKRQMDRMAELAQRAIRELLKAQKKIIATLD